MFCTNLSASQRWEARIHHPGGSPAMHEAAFDQNRANICRAALSVILPLKKERKRKRKHLKFANLYSSPAPHICAVINLARCN